MCYLIDTFLNVNSIPNSRLRELRAAPIKYNRLALSRRAPSAQAHSLSGMSRRGIAAIAAQKIHL
jgi:hypothetical protein